MDFKALKEKYQQLLLENNRLREEIKRLRTQLGMDAIHEESHDSANKVSEFLIVSEPELFDRHIETKPLAPPEAIDKRSDASAKIRLFQSLFKGRDDVYAKRWENLVVGLYPLLSNETCWFLAIDFDDDGWQKDVTMLREVCSLFGVPFAVERSRSGNGAHAWFFFENPVQASLARKFGSALLTYAMGQRHELTFRSYDRFFPNQDTMPKGGFGNLIALPLQKTARRNNNSVFIDEHFYPIEDQWAFLSSIQRLSEKNLEELISKLSPGNELGTLRTGDEEASKPWESTKKPEVNKNDFPGKVEVVKANMLFIPKNGFSQRALNHLMAVPRKVSCDSKAQISPMS